MPDAFGYVGLFLLTKTSLSEQSLVVSKSNILLVGVVVSCLRALHLAADIANPIPGVHRDLPFW